MLDLVTKVDNTAPPSGNLTAEEFNNHTLEAENAVSESGQSLDASSAVVTQLSAAIGIGGKSISRATAETALVGETVLPDNSSASVTINLPLTPFTGAIVRFEQVFNQPYSVNNLIVGRNGQTIGGLAEDMTVDTDNIKFHMRFNGTTWVPIKDQIVGATP